LVESSSFVLSILYQQEFGATDRGFGVGGCKACGKGGMFLTVKERSQTPAALNTLVGNACVVYTLTDAMQDEFSSARSTAL